MKEKCKNDIPGLDLRCHGGYLWELTHDIGNRQNTGRRCLLCNPQKAKYVVFKHRETGSLYGFTLDPTKEKE